ncbi:MAG TPA: hypothetical protein VGA00_14175 [Acidiferrobacterales bacterium]|jgi:hypothetical protein
MNWKKEHTIALLLFAIFLSGIIKISWPDFYAAYFIRGESFGADDLFSILAKLAIAVAATVAVYLIAKPRNDKRD